jgi:hypothetical protein
MLIVTMVTIYLIEVAVLRLTLAPSQQQEHGRTFDEQPLLIFANCSLLFYKAPFASGAEYTLRPPT